jgi:apolipoprotein N-acyltransferase
MKTNLSKSSSYWRIAAERAVERAQNALIFYGVLLVLGQIIALFSSSYELLSPAALIFWALIFAIFGAAYWSRVEPTKGLKFGLIPLSLIALLQILAVNLIGIIVVGTVIYLTYQGMKEAQSFYGEQTQTDNSEILDADL